MVTKDLGMVTAYAYAVAGGYTGTEAEFTQLMADLAVVVDDFDNFSVNVTTLPAGSSATASYSDGVLSLGIPKGDKGDKGNTGDTGSPAGFGTVSATVDANIGTPSVEVTASGSDTAKNFAFAFHNLKGEKGDKGDTGEVSEAELTQAFEDFSANGTVANAEQLTTDIRANDQTPYLFRTAGGSVDIGDREYINGIVGGTVAWNQIINGNFSATSYWAPSKGTIAVADNVLTFTLTDVPTSTWDAKIQQSLFDYMKTNDKILLAGTLSPSITAGLQVALTNATAGNNPYHGTTIPANTWKREEMILNVNNGSHHFAQVYLNTDYANWQVGDSFKVKDFIAINLTQMFGSTIADYIYSLEQATAGAGVAFFKTLGFNKPYYAYNAGELMSVRGLISHDMVGFNAWDEEWELGDLNTSNGQNYPATNRIRSKNYIRVLPNTTYYFKSPYNSIVCFYDANKNFVNIGNATLTANATFTTQSNVHYMRISPSASYGTTYHNNICINLAWDNSRNGEYEPYQKWSYPLDSDLELRGIPKLENGNLYYDGDAYEADGTVTRKYGIVDLGDYEWIYSSTNNSFTATIPNMASPTASADRNKGIVSSKYPPSTVVTINTSQDDKSMLRNNGTIIIRDTSYSDKDIFKTAMNGVYLVYELATPTTETADPYTSPQTVSDFGTEEYVIDDDVFAIPVGHNTDYPVDLKAKLEMAPNSPPGDGMYVVKQTSGTNEYVPLIIPSGIPPVPTENGSYTLTATVSGGTTTLSWS